MARGIGLFIKILDNRPIISAGACRRSTHHRGPVVDAADMVLLDKGVDIGLVVLYLSHHLVEQRTYRQRGLPALGAIAHPPARRDTEASRR